MNEQTMTVMEAANAAGVSQVAIYQAIRNQRIKATRYGKRMYVIDRASFEAYYANKLAARAQQ